MFAVASCPRTVYSLYDAEIARAHIVPNCTEPCCALRPDEGEGGCRAGEARNTEPARIAAIGVSPRLTPRKTPPGEFAVWLLARWAMRGMFARVRLRETAGNPRAAGVPLLGLANHPSWWDGYLALLLARHYGLPRYLMMDEPQLRRYGFFRWAGCFSVDRTDPRESARSVAYAAHLLDRPA